MKRCLADVNVVLALLVKHHEHHGLANAWFDTLGAGEAGLCRTVQLALIRLLGNKSVMGKYAVSALAAWDLIGELLCDERIGFASEPATFDSAFSALLQYPGPTGKLLGDAYLAAFAITSARTLVTLDGGFREFKGLDLILLLKPN